MYIDSRHFFYLAINMLKYVVPGMPWDWDPFHTISNLTWMNAFVYVTLFLLFSFISIKVHVPLTDHSVLLDTTTDNSTNTMHTLLLKFGELSAPLAVVLMAAALIFPQALFWYAYPIILLISTCSPEFRRFANWFHAVLTTIPVLRVILRATIVGRQALGPQADNRINEETAGNAQAPAMILGEAMEDIEAGEVV